MWRSRTGGAGDDTGETGADDGDDRERRGEDELPIPGEAHRRDDDEADRRTEHSRHQPRQRALGHDEAEDVAVGVLEGQALLYRAIGGEQSMSREAAN